MADETNPTDCGGEAPEAAGPAAETASNPKDAEIAALTAEVATLMEEIATLKASMLRLAADADNTRKRLEREKAEATLYAATNFAKDLLSVADNMARALAAVSPETREAADEATRNLLAGVEVTERELLNTFQRHGIRKLVTIGEKFDPNMHQALFEVPTGEHPPGTVVQEVQSGYAIGERCLRPAMVGVAKAE
ncbi:MAG: nucleotide exchange factor GrpE [Alphaproteobacteria bacterium]|nr:nucleotide exchange factor GrpE [Alphaproteobacteria bacterium]